MSELRNARHLSVHDLRRRINEGDIDTVVIAFTDMQGRLQGKRLHAVYFAEHVLDHGIEGSAHLLAVDVEMNMSDRYAMSSPDKADGGIRLVLDPQTIRLLQHQPGTVIVQCDAVVPIRRRRQSPRTILKQQLAAAASRDYDVLAGTQLQFMAFHTSYEDAWTTHYRDLPLVNQYSIDSSILGGSRVEPLLREIRNKTYAAGMDVASVTGERNLGQYEIGFRQADALTAADNHTVFKTLAKEIAAQHGRAITFMPKYDERRAIPSPPLSLRGTDGSTVFSENGGRTKIFDAFVAGLLATLYDFTLLYAPNINSYKRFTPGSPTPTAIAWGPGQRCAIRVLGEDQSARVQNRVPGGTSILFGFRDDPVGLYGLVSSESVCGVTGDGPRRLPSISVPARGTAGLRFLTYFTPPRFGDDIVDSLTPQWPTSIWSVRRSAD